MEVILAFVYLQIFPLCGSTTKGGLCTARAGLCSKIQNQNHSFFTI